MRKTIESPCKNRGVIIKEGQIKGDAHGRA